MEKDLGKGCGNQAHHCHDLLSDLPCNHGVNPFPMPGVRSVSAPANPAVVPHQFIGTPVRGGQTPSSAAIQFSEGGPVRLTWFVEMPLGACCARWNQMVSQGRFKHIRLGSISLEGATAWSVWLRVDQWSTALQNRPRLMCGALFHVANRTVSFQRCSHVLVAHLLRKLDCRVNFAAEIKFRMWFHLSSLHSMVAS